MLIKAYKNKDKNIKDWFAYCSIYSFIPLLGHNIDKIIKKLQTGKLIKIKLKETTIYIQLAV